MLVATLLALCPGSHALPATDPYAVQREAFAKVRAAQRAGNFSLAARLVVGLEDYPLYPYYLYDDLRRRLHLRPTAEIARFLSAYDDSYLASRLRGQWLSELARTQRWQTFLEFYRPGDDLKSRCQQLEARIRSGILEGVLEDTRAIWLNGSSLPDECDLAFTHLYASSLMDDDLVWARYRLTMAAGNSSLARYLGTRLTTPRHQALHALWTEAHQNPSRALTHAPVSDDAETRAIMTYAVKRLLRQSVEAAEAGWSSIAGRMQFDADERGEVAAAIAAAAASDDHPRQIALLDAVAQTSVTADVERYRLRRGLAARAWPELVRWTRGDPISDLNPLRWRYWRARALEATGAEHAARKLFTELAQERDYYGFLAADRLQQEYALNFVPVAPSASERATIEAIPGVVRSGELLRLGDKFQARREWYFELERLDRRGREVAAAIAAEWGWPDSAIAALGKAQSYDDLELRFPLLYVDIASENARRRKLEPAHVMAIMRSESAFVSDARSSAGALGLMQLLPGTARETARRIGVRFPDAKTLYQPRTNIALGAAYLAQVLARFDGNFVMASAAYNAGPQRVRQWQENTCVPADIWIDTIPFTETRRYVRRALFYAAIYEWRMEQDITRITTAMPTIPAAGSHNIADCGS